MSKIKSEILETVRSSDKFFCAFSISLWLIILAIVTYNIGFLSWAFGFGGVGLLSSIVTLILAIKGEE